MKSPSLHNSQYTPQVGLAVRLSGKGSRAARVGAKGGRHRSYTIAERLWARTIKSIEPDGCWLVQGAALPHSGHVQLNRKAEGLPVIRAHRLSWVLHYGPIPAGLCVLHRCDQPRCVRPDHLFLGTQADNVADAVAKGRYSAWHRSGVRLNGQVSKRHQKILARLFDRVSHVNVPVRGEVAS